MKAVVKNTVWKSDDIVSLDLTLESSLNALPGQFILVSLPGYSQRAYSIVNETNGVITLGVKVQGGTSKVLSQLKLGDSFELLGPFGTFTPRPAKRVVLIGGGIGITPLVSLYNYYKNQEDVIVDVLLSFNGDSFFLESFDSPKVFNTLTGRRISVDDVVKNSTVYICGPERMIISLRNDLIAKGHNSNNIFSEDFS